MNGQFDEVLLARIELQRYAEGLLGKRGWFLLRNYGRLMSGPDSGRYVSGLPAHDAREIVDALVRGETVEVHLMHRHVSGNYESSQLRLRNGRLEMLFADRIERA